MKPRKRRKFTHEFKAEAVRLCEIGDRTVTHVARDLDLTETALREQPFTGCSSFDRAEGHSWGIACVVMT